MSVWKNPSIDVPAHGDKVIIKRVGYDDWSQFQRVLTYTVALYWDGEWYFEGKQYGPPLAWTEVPADDDWMKELKG